MQHTAKTNAVTTVESVTVEFTAAEAKSLADGLYNLTGSTEFYNLLPTWEQREAVSDLRFALTRGLADTTTNSATLVGMAVTDVEVVREIRVGNKIPAIKRLRTISGAGLKEAKDAVDAISPVILG